TLDGLCCGTKYSDCSLLLAIRVKPMLKCGRRSYQGPGTPICSVQLSAESSAIGWRLRVASLPPKKSGVAVNDSPFSSRLLIQTSLTRRFRQSVKRLTLSALDSIESKWSVTSESGRFSYTYCRIV